ncbi:MAG: NADH-quinone oxidoreductase subunit NuoK [Candidatus Baldrarchaeia archaeon]
MAIDLFSWYIGTVVVLYSIGLYCLASKRNLVKMVIAIEILLAAANLNFIVMSYFMRTGYVHTLAHAIVIISMAIGACVAAIALSLVMNAYRHYKTLDTRKMSRLRW